MAVILSGRSNIGASKDAKTVSFSTPFSAVPSVVVLPGTDGSTNTNNAQNVNLYIVSVTTTEFRVGVDGPIGAPCYFEWRAMTT